MSLFNLFGKRADINEGVRRFRETPDAVLLDVRTPEEYARGRVPDSVNLPLDRLESIPYGPERPLFVYCHSGARSARACAWLSRRGYSAANIGGIMEYRGEIEGGREA